MRALKTILASLVATGFLLGATLATLSARSAQEGGRLTPNYKGGSMEYQDGYLIGAALFALSFAWFFGALKFWRTEKTQKGRYG